MKYVATYRFLSDDADMEASFHVEVEAGDEDTAAVQAHDKLCWQMAQWCSSSTSVAFDFTTTRFVLICPGSLSERYWTSNPK